MGGRSTLLTLVALTVTLLAALVVPTVASASALDPLAPSHGPRQLLAPLFPPAATPAPEPQPDPAQGAEPPRPTATPRCYGAASADPNVPCSNPDLDYAINPAPSRARAAQKQEVCTEEEFTALFKVCYWGAPAATASRTIALLGDSHAAHWRAAVQVVARAKNWRGLSIQRAGCPLTNAYPDLPGRDRQQGCIKWNQAVQKWLRGRPEIDTVFTSAHLSAVIPAPGQEMRAAQRFGYASAMLQVLEGSVKRIVVIRGTPRISSSTIACLEKAAAARTQPPGQACALTREYALRPDPLVQSAKMLRDPRIQVANLANFFCRAQICNPVIGGVLVLRDVSHMTTTYSTTLGPYLLNAVNRLSAGWR